MRLNLDLARKHAQDFDLVIDRKKETMKGIKI